MSNAATRNLTLKISRYDPERDDAPHWESYQVEADPLDRVLDVIQKVKWYQDESLALRRSCAHGGVRLRRHADQRRERTGLQNPGQETSRPTRSPWSRSWAFRSSKT